MDRELQAMLDRLLVGADSYEVGIGVVVREFLGRMQFVETLNELLPWDEKQCAVSPGQRLLALVMAFVEDRRALFRIPEVYARRDVELLLGEGVQPEQLNDKALARALDKLHAADAKRVYSTICLRAVEAYGVTMQRLHADTTSVSVYGAYDGEPHSGLEITYGFSKDHRPDLKQFKLGATVTEDGIPIAGDVFNGNEADQMWNQKLLDWLDGWLSREKRGETLLCADSALVTTDNLERLSSDGFLFVSRLPHSFAWADIARAEALHGPEDLWQDVGQLAPGKNKARYRLRETSGDIGGRTYRLIVVHSSSLSDRKGHSLLHQAEKEQEAIERTGRKLERQTWSCREDAEAALGEAISELDPRFWDTRQRVEAEVWEPPRRRGRPAKGETRPESTIVYRAHLELGQRRDDELRDAQRWHSTFILITNDWKRTPKELFMAYRGQATVEGAFRWLKGPVRTSPVFLKKPERVEAFGYVMLMAYLVYALVQRAVRSALPPGEKLEVEGRKTDRPTAQVVLDVIAHAKVLHVQVPGERLRRILLAPSPKIRRIMELLEIPADAFLTLPYHNSA